MLKTTLKIEGMMCSMCEAHICEVIRKTVPNARKVSASRGKAEASFLTEYAPDAATLISAIAETGYTCTSVQTVEAERKGLLGWR